MRKMRDSGLKILHLGIESHSPKRLDSINKKVSAQSTRRTVEEAHKLGIDTVGLFLLGLPGQTAEDYRRTADYAVELGLTYASFHLVNPLPGTEMYDGGDLFPNHVSGELHTHDMFRLRREAYLRFYLRPRYIGRRILQRPGGILKDARFFASFIKNL
jgi:radical SAM superfamily enzyme YgiQ (UPF0313 family)